MCGPTGTGRPTSPCAPPSARRRDRRLRRAAGLSGLRRRDRQADARRARRGSPSARGRRRPARDYTPRRLRARRRRRDRRDRGARARARRRRAARGCTCAACCAGVVAAPAARPRRSAQRLRRMAARFGRAAAPPLARARSIPARGAHRRRATRSASCAALELALAGGDLERAARARGDLGPGAERYAALKFGLDLDRASRWRERLDARVDASSRRVSWTRWRGCSPRACPRRANAFKAIGYREVVAALDAGSDPRRRRARRSSRDHAALRQAAAHVVPQRARRDLARCRRDAPAVGGDVLRQRSLARPLSASGARCVVYSAPRPRDCGRSRWTTTAAEPAERVLQRRAQGRAPRHRLPCQREEAGRPDQGLRQVHGAARDGTVRRADRLQARDHDGDRVGARVAARGRRRTGPRQGCARTEAAATTDLAPEEPLPLGLGRRGRRRAARRGTSRIRAFSRSIFASYSWRTSWTCCSGARSPRAAASRVGRRPSPRRPAVQLRPQPRDLLVALGEVLARAAPAARRRAS